MSSALPTQPAHLHSRPILEYVDPLDQIILTLRIPTLPLPRVQAVALATLTPRPLLTQLVDTSTALATLAASFAVASQILKIAVAASRPSRAPATRLDLLGLAELGRRWQRGC